MFKHKPVKMALFKHGTHSHVPSLGVLVLVTLVTSNCHSSNKCKNTEHN